MTTVQNIQLAHGGGGRLTRDLIDSEIVSRFGDGPLAGLPDAASLPRVDGTLVFTTDSFVVQPLEFPGGNIGHLAVHGTVNDLAVAGAEPLYLSLAMILEEGLPLEVLRRVLDAVLSGTRECGIQVVTGDTKVVPRGKADGVFLNTAGIGCALPEFDLDPAGIREGDVLLASGPLGDHGMAVMASREGFVTENAPESDTAPVFPLVAACRQWGGDIRFMRDPTRGGCATVLNEIVSGRDVGIALEEASLPFSPRTRAVSEMLGLDLLHVASEGRMLAVCDKRVADDVLSSWTSLPQGCGACRIGMVTNDSGRVLMNTVAGGRRLVDLPRGELLPRIC